MQPCMGIKGYKFMYTIKQYRKKMQSILYGTLFLRNEGKNVKSCFRVNKWFHVNEKKSIV